MPSPRRISWSWCPSFQHIVDQRSGETSYRVDHPLVDDFLEFVAGRARPNTVRAYAHDLKIFFDVVGKEPTDVVPADVLAFVSAQRRSRPGAENVVRISDGSGGLSEATIKPRLAAVSSLYGYLLTVGVVQTNPVPRGLPTRRARRELRGVPLVRGTRRLPRILNPNEAEALMAALRTRRDRAMVEAMLLAGMRRCEVLLTQALAGVDKVGHRPLPTGGQHVFQLIRRRYEQGSVICTPNRPSGVGHHLRRRGPRRRHPRPATAHCDVSLLTTVLPA